MTGATSRPVTVHPAGAVRGARAVLPIVPGAVAFGLVYGFLAGERGSALLEIGLMSMLVFAGASQFLALELLGRSAAAGGIVLGVLVINLRHLLMGPALLPWLGPVRPVQAYASLYFMTDESWGISVAEQRRGGRDAAFLLGAGLASSSSGGLHGAGPRAGDLSYPGRATGGWTTSPRRSSWPCWPDSGVAGELAAMAGGCGIAVAAKWCCRGLGTSSWVPWPAA